MLVLAMEFSRSARSPEPEPRAEEGARRSPPPASKDQRTRATVRSLTTEQRRSDRQRGGDPGETRRSRTCPLQQR
jgi:hypothetical protein